MVLKVVINRLSQSLILLLLVSVAVFTLLHLTPGDPGVLLYGPNVTPQDLLQIRQRWGLDDPIHIQYLRWLCNVITGDLGRSYADGRPVLMVIAERAPATMLLSAAALTIAVIVGVPLGFIAATNRHSAIDGITTLMATIFYSTPPFWLGVLLILFLSLHLGWLPSGGMRLAGGELDPADVSRHLILPAATLALREAGRCARLTRASVLEVLSQDYIRTATAKGLAQLVVATRHTMRNALLPLVTLLGFSVPTLISGAVVVETVFAWPGMGRLAIESALQRNYPIVMGEVLIVTTLALVGSLLADIAYAMVDPRISKIV